MSDIILANQDIVKVDRKIQTDIFNYSSSEFFINMKESDIPPKGHPDRGDFIKREREKCRIGLTVGGVYIPGNLYFHFNHFYLIGDDGEDESGRTQNTAKIATLRDNDWIIHTEYAQAVKEKKGYCLASSRQIGKTTCLTALTLREVSLYENAEAMLIFGSLQDKQSFTKKIKVAIEHGQPFIIRTPIDKDWSNKTEIRFGYTNKDNTTVEKGRIFLYNVDGGTDSEKGAGKALVHGSKVYYKDRVGNIEDCKIGDEIYGADGKLTTITGVYPQGVVDLFKITFIDGRTVICCKEHLWTVSTNQYNFQTVDTNHLLTLIRVNDIYLPKVKYTKQLKSFAKKLNIHVFKKHPKIKNIEKVESNYATCISVDNKDKLFLTDNFIPTHNTVTFFAMDEALKHGSKVYYEDKEDVIENVKVGDKIFGKNGELTTVLEVYPQGITDIYKITLKDGRTVETSPNHLWEVVNKNNNKQILTTKQLFLKKTKTNPFYIPLNKAVEYSEKQFIVDPYILGYHMGDGDTKKGRFCSTELDIVEKYRKFYKVTDMNDNLHYYARGLVKDLKKINVYGNKHIPEEYFYGSIKQRKELLSALLDSDGGVTICNNATTSGAKTVRVIFTNKNLKLAEAVKRLSYSLGYSCKLHSKNNYSYDKKTKEKLLRGIIYYVEIFTKENLFFTKVKADKIINNKINRNYHKNISILSIEKVESDYSTCIKVDNQDSLFLTNDFIVTHNCGKYPFQASWEAVEPALKGKNGYRSAPYFSWTGGETDKAKEAFKFTLNPEASNLLEFETEGKKTSKVMFATYRQDCKIKIPFTTFLDNENIKYDKKNQDLKSLTIEVSNVEEATKKTLKELENKKKDKDPLASIKHRAYYPLCLKDILARETKNNFNKEFIDQQLEYLKDVGYDKVEVFRDIKTGEIKHKFSFAPIIEDWRKPNFLDTPVKIWDFPKYTEFGVHVIGCLPPNEKVLTQKGLLNIEEVTLNDKLVNEDGNYVNIINLQKYYVKDENLFEMGVNGSQRLTRFTGEHPILVSEDKTRYVSIDKRKREGLKQRYKDFNFTYKKISDIKVGDWVKVPNIYKKEIEIDFDILWDEINCGNCNKLNNPLRDKDFWWLVGLWLGDGWLDKQRVSFSFNKNEVYYIEKFKTVVKKLFDKEYTSVKQGKGCIELYISSVKLNLFLNKHFGKYAQGKFISEWVKYLNPEFKKELIRGYLNSDGNVSINKKQHFVLNFVSINLELLEGFQDIFYSLGYTCGISLLRNESECTFNDIKCKTKKCYSLSLFNSNAIKFLEDIFDEKDHKISKVVLKRDYTSQGIKKYFFSDDLEFIYLKIKTLNVTKYTGWVHNFECDTHTYMCHRITTHNCDGYRENETLSSDSLGYFTVLRRLHSDLEDPFRGKQVASWLGRKKTVKEMLQLLLDVAEWYNAQILYEHVDRSVLDFFEAKRKLHLLIDTVPLQKEISIKTKTKNNKGLRPTVGNKQFLLNSTLGWVNEELEDESLGYSRIMDEVLLNQLAEYDPDENLDCYIGFSHAVAAYNYFEKFGVPQVEDSNKKQITSNKKPVIYNAFGIPYNKNKKNAFGF